MYNSKMQAMFNQKIILINNLKSSVNSSTKPPSPEGMLKLVDTGFVATYGGVQLQLFGRGEAWYVE